MSWENGELLIGEGSTYKESVFISWQFGDATTRVRAVSMGTQGVYGEWEFDQDEGK